MTEKFYSYVAANGSEKKLYEFKYPCYNDGDTTFVLTEFENLMAKKIKKDVKSAKMLVALFFKKEEKNRDKYEDDLQAIFKAEKWYRQQGYGEGEIEFLRLILLFGLAGHKLFSK